jgi:hypothetical protein
MTKIGFEPATLLNLTRHKLLALDPFARVEILPNPHAIGEQNYVQGFYLDVGESLDVHAELLARGFLNLVGNGKKLICSGIAESDQQTISGTITCTAQAQ